MVVPKCVYFDRTGHKPRCIPVFCERHLSPSVPFLPAGTDASLCCIRPDQNTPGQTKAPFSPRNAEKRVQVNVFTWPCRNRHSPVRSPQALSSEKLRSAVRSEVLDGTDHLRGVGVLVVVPRHDLNLVGVVVATLVFRTLFVVVPNFETTVTVPQRTVVVLNPACSYHYYTTFQRYFQVFPVSFFAGIFMRVITYILIYQSSESLGSRGLRRGVCPAQVLSSVRDLAALKGDPGVDLMGGEQIPDGCVAGCLWPLQLFPGGFWIEISPDVFLKGMVGDEEFLFDMEQSTIKDVIHP